MKMRQPFSAFRLIAAFAAVVCSVVHAASVPPVGGAHGMVVTAHQLATKVGVDVLKSGGNAVDAAVAVGYAMAVVYPAAGNLGGGGFMTIQFADGRKTFLDFREKAPLAATRDMYLDSTGNVIKGASTKGHLAVGVPGSVAGLEYAREKYGTRSRSTLIAPAITYAERGFVLDDGDIALFVTANDDFRDDAATAAIFLNHGQPYKAGNRLVQKDLAKTLRLIAQRGPDVFYRGSIADAIAASSDAGKGIITKADLAQYKVRELAPIECDYRGYQYLGDPDFVKNPLDRLLDKAYAAKIRAAIDPAKAGISRDMKPGVEPHEGNNTTHYSIVDSQGNAVSVTYTLNDWFGAKVTAAKTGILLNDEMDDFTAKLGVPNLYGLVQGEANSITPGKRPLSSMSPTIVSRDGKPVMVIGTPGGSRIITVVVHCILNVVDYGMNIQEAIDAPRFHQQWLPETTNVEIFALSPDTRKILVEMGHKLGDPQPPGHAAGILVGAPSLGGKPLGTDRFYGANDPRRGTGLALGY